MERGKHRDEWQELSEKRLEDAEQFRDLRRTIEGPAPGEFASRARRKRPEVYRLKVSTYTAGIQT